MDGRQQPGAAGRRNGLAAADVARHQIGHRLERFALQLVAHRLACVDHLMHRFPLSIPLPLEVRCIVGVASRGFTFVAED